MGADVATAARTAGRLLLIKTLAALAVTFGPIAAVCVLLFMIVGVLSNAQRHEAQDAVVRFVESVDERTALLYLDTEESTEIPWPLIAAIAGVQTDHGRSVPGDPIKRGVDPTTSIIPVALPPIEVTPTDSDRTYEGIFLLDTDAVDDADVFEHIADADGAQHAETAAAAVAAILHAAVDNDERWSGIPAAWPDEHDVWTDAIEQLPIMSIADPHEGTAIPASRCADDDVLLIGDSITVGIEAAGALGDDITVDAERNRTVAAGLAIVRRRLATGWTGPIVINLGTNGWGTLQLANGTPASPAATLSEIADLASPGQLMFVTPRDVDNPAISAAIRNVSEAIDELANSTAEAEITVVAADTWPADPGSVAADGIHLTPAGYESLGSWLRARICNPTAGGYTPTTPALAERIWTLALRYARIAPDTTATGITLPGVPPVVMDAYTKAVEWGRTTWPDCGIDVPLLAAFGQVETGHGQGRTIGPDGDIHPPIFSYVAPRSYPNRLSPTDQKFFHLPAATYPYLHATGMMQFMPPTWNEVEPHITVADQSGRPDPQNVFDATRAAVHYLCQAANGPILEQANKSRAIDAYNPASYYESRILEAESTLRQMARVATVAGEIPAGVDPTSPEIARVIRWAVSMQGHGYAAVNPYRTGEVPWPGGSIDSDFGSSTYTHPAGAIVFDCSGFLIAAFRQIGLDFTDWGIYGSQQFPGNPNLVSVPDRDDLQPGDLIIYAPGSSGIGHIIMYLDGDTYIDAAFPDGVAIRTGIQWHRVIGMMRVPINDTVAA